VVDAGSEVNLRGLERVIGRESNAQEEHSGRIWTVGRSHDCRLPVKQVISDRSSTARRGGISPEVSKFLVDSLESHSFDVELMCKLFFSKGSRLLEEGTLR